MNTELLKSKLLEAAFNGSLTHADTSKWKKTTMGEIFEHHTGKALKKSDKEGVLKPYITTSNVYWNRFELDTVKEMYFKPKELAKYTITKGDLLVCEGGDVGRSAIWDFDYDVCFQNHIHRLRPKKEVCLKFYYYIMLYYKWTNKIQGTGIGLEGFSSGVLDKLKVPYPPLVDQQQIVSTLEEGFSVLGAIANAKENLSTTAKMLRSKILQAAFDGTLTGADTSKWEYKKLGDISNYGKCISVDVKEIRSDAWILELEDLEKGSARVLKRLTLSERNVKGTRHEFKKGQLLYSKLRTYLNKVLIAPEDGYCSSEIVPISFNNNVNVEYMYHYMRSPFVLRYTALCNYGIKMPRISPAQANMINVPLPPLAEQQRIVAKIEELFAEIDKLTK